MFMHISGSKIEHFVNFFTQVEGRFPGSWEELYSCVLLLGSKKAPGMYKTL